MADLWRLSAVETARRIRSKELSAKEVITSSLQRLDAVNGRINAVVQEMPESALQAAEQIDQSIARGEDPGPLAGVPVTIKVNVDQAGYATTNGLSCRKT